MASALQRSVRLLLRSNPLVNLQRSVGQSVEKIEAKPYKFSLGIVPVTIVSIPFCLAGAWLAKEGAEFLEEWNIFVPEDDDD